MPKTEEKAKVVGVGWGTYLNGALTISVAACSKDDLNKKFWDNIHFFCGVMVWYVVNQIIIHFSKNTYQNNICASIVYKAESEQ